MLGPSDDRTPPMTPQLALRVAIIGGCALVMFAVIFFRLWFLQVLSGSQYVQAAQVNVVRSIPVAAPRGEIVDRNGTALVQSVQVPAIQISPESLPKPVSLASKNYIKQPAQDYVIYNRLAQLLKMSTKPHTCKFEIYYANHKIDYYSPKLAPIPCLVAKGVAASQYANVTIKTNVNPDIQFYIAEHITNFRGVLAQEVYLRKYPLGSAGAQMFGTLSQISLKELSWKNFNGVQPGSIVGQSGLEYQYNPELQGTDGEERVKVNSENQFEGYAKGKKPVQGDTLKLSIDAQLEKVGQEAVWQSILRNGGQGGAFVAMNPDNGAVYAMGSAPSYLPNKVSPTISNKEWRFLRDPANNTPLLNRAVNGYGPDGSTFKVITATAALESGQWNLSDVYSDTGHFCFPGTSDCLRNSGGNAYGTVDLETAIQDSVDTFFYNLGYKLNGAPIPVYDHPNGGALQQWAAKFGIGRPTGIDLPGESTGEMASPKLFASLWRQERQCDTATGRYKGHARHPAKISQGSIVSGGCGIANTADWTVGDNVNAAVGQGDVQVTPLQLATVYSAIANGGTIVTPHIGEQIDGLNGTVVQNIDPAPKRHLNIQPQYLAAIQQGLRQAVQAGTSADVMGSFPQEVHGKTGTAQYISGGVETDYAWYACYVPRTATSKPITVVVWVPKGGFGDVAAAPVARQILNQWFYGKRGPFIEGNSKTL